MNGQDTLRSHLEAIHEVAADHSRPGAQTEIRERAVAALAILENAPAVLDGTEERMVVIPDPVPVVSPRPNQQEETP